LAVEAATIAFDNVILSDAAVTKLIACCYDQSRALGVLAQTCSETMARPSMVARLDVADLDLTDIRPRRACGCREAERATRASGQRRGANGQPWGASQNSPYRPAFIEAAKAAGLGAEVSIYALRHSGISRALLRGVPTNVVANLADTSEKIIRQHYARDIGHDPLARKALLQLAPPTAPKVVAVRAK
jgi:integrase